MMAEHAFNWCLGSHGQKPGLLERYPLDFLPVALQAAEALSTEYLANKRKSRRRFAGDIAKVRGDTVEEPKEEVDLPPPALIDDSPTYTFWKSAHHVGPYERCLSLIYDCVRQIAAATPNLFVRRAGPDLAASRLATVQSFLFDVCLVHFEEPGFDSVLHEALLNKRMYLVSGLAFWVQEGLAQGWPGMFGEQRQVVVEHLNSLKSGGDPGAPFRRLQYLAALPQDDLSAELRSEVEIHRASGNTPFRRPETIGGKSFPSPIDHSDDAERLLGDCPPDSRDQFKRFYREYHDYVKTQNDETERARLLPLLLKTADEIASVFSRPENTLNAHGRIWLWSALESLLAASLNPIKDEDSMIRPPDTLVRRAAEAALVALEEFLEVPMVDDTMEEANPPPFWEGALRLANVAIAFDVIQGDEALIHRFDAVLRQAARNLHPGIQRSLFTDLHPWHWRRNPSRRGEIRGLILEKARHGEVLKWGLEALDNFPDQDRAEILANVLQRTDIAHREEFVRMLGQCLGVWGITVFQDGQRSTVAPIVLMLLTNPAKFALLQNEEIYRDLLADIAIGMELRVRGSLHQHSVIADFADWLGRIVRLVRTLPHGRAGNIGILTMALHFLERDERKGCPLTVAKPWWDAVFPLLEETLQNGDVDEVWMAIFDQHGGACNDLVSVEEVCRLVGALADRIESGLAGGHLNVNLRNLEQGPRNTWRDCADIAAQWLITLLDAGRLTQELERETVFGLFQRLSAPPLNSEWGLHGVHRMQGA
jgi:hypothetical protein